MSRIHFIGGEKGGVGKSVVARVLAQWFIDRSLPFAAVDADRSHGALKRYYADYTQAVDLSRPESADQIMDRALAGERRVLVDLPAQSTRDLARWLADADIKEFAREMDVDLSYWHVTDGGYASVAELGDALELLGEGFSYSVVKNHGRARDFSQFEESPARERLELGGGAVLELEELDATAMYKIDRYGSSFWAAVNIDQGPGALKPLERRRTKLWLDRIHADLDALSARL